MYLYKFYMSKINYMGPCKCKCKKIGHVSVNDLHLHGLYKRYVQLLTFTHTTLVKASVDWY
jgi:hypothetical protein